MNSKMLDAFIAQTYTPHGGIETFESKREEVFQKANEIQKEWIKEAKDILNRPQDFIHYVDIPTQLTKDELNEKTISHPHLANYDHSLETNRLAALREKYDYVAPEPQIPDTIEMTTEHYDNIEPADINLNGIFDNLFGV